MVNHALMVCARCPGVHPSQCHDAKYCFDDVTYLFLIRKSAPDGRLLTYLLEKPRVAGIARVQEYWDVVSLHTLYCCAVIDPFSRQIDTTHGYS